MSGSNDQFTGTARRYGKVTIAQAAAQLKAGGLVAVPTETVYGLAADSTNAAAVAEIYRTKGRPDFNPLIVHIADLEQARILGQFNALAEKLATFFWPGPLTLIVPQTQDCPVTPAVTAGLDTIALRSPAHPLMRTLLETCDLYLAAPSANKSGGISPTAADHVRASLAEHAPMILDGGSSEAGLESTIIAVQRGDYQILRPGPITAEQIQRATGQPAMVTEGAATKIVSPGQLASHYAPSKPVMLNMIARQTDAYHIGFGQIDGDLNLSPSGDLAEAASNLFAALHQADASDADKIAVAPIPQEAMGVAINDRLKRAAHRT